MNDTIRPTRQPSPPQPLSPWGVLPSIGFALVVFIAFLVVQTVAVTIFAYLQIQGEPNLTLSSEILSMASNGLAISISLIPGALAGSLLIILFAYLRQNITVKQYLKLHLPNFKQLALWTGILILFALSLEFVNQYLDRPTPDWMLDSYKTAGILPLFWFTLVVAAPVFEELLFRGFLLEGLRHSKLGNLGAVLITSAVWASIHLQYELFEVVSIFLIGIILGYARIKTDSLYTPIILHALMNLAATVQVAALVSS